MFGGVAVSYCLYEFDGEPFKEGVSYYIYAIHPYNKKRKKVRWYVDKKHADLMPKTVPNKPLYTVFGFKDEEDFIICIKEKDLTTSQAEEYFAGKWRAGEFFGGIWYAPSETLIPPNINRDNFFLSNWEEFKDAGQRHAIAMNASPDNCWFKED